MVVFSMFLIGCFIAAASSARLGKRVWSPRVFAWRNPLRQSPTIDLRPDSPLLINNPRYYSFMSIGSGIGGVLHFDITNRSNKPVHSYQCRYYSPIRVGNGSYGSIPETGLLARQSRDDAISANEYAPLTLTIDFVQFADGTTWFSNSPQSTVKSDGLKAGAKAAANYLLTVMNRDGVQAVMTNLPRIHADVSEPSGAATNPHYVLTGMNQDGVQAVPKPDESAPYRTANNPEFGIFGFYCGVTNIAVRVENEYREGGPQRVERFLRSYQE